MNKIMTQFQLLVELYPKLNISQNNLCKY